MSTSKDPRREQPNTYVMQDRSHQDELTRLLIQDQMVTALMGGVLPEQPDPKIFQRVLDVGCGTGGWLIEMAKTYPCISRLVGVDASSKMLGYARAQAEAQQVNDRVEFHAMDALLLLEFPSEYFDLVNHRFAMSWLRTWDWPKLLSEYQRVTRPGGVIRVTETNVTIGSSSPALSCLYEMTLDAYYKAGHCFIKDWNGLTDQLAPLLHRHGVQNMQTRAHRLDFRAGTPEGQRFAEDMRLAYRTILPFLRKWTPVPDDYDAIYQQALVEMQEPDFVVTWDMLTAWGTKRT